jgi:hypothetical protein
MSLSIVSAHADWSGPVTYMEGIVGCNGLNPDLTVKPGVNVSSGNTGEYRVGAGIFSLQGTELLFKSNEGPDAPAVEVGSFNTLPTCVVEDAGSPATPQWTPITLDSAVSAQVSLIPDFSSCDYDSDHDVFTRTNLYRLSLTLANGSVVSASWQVQGSYSSPESCATLNEPI